MNFSLTRNFKSNVHTYSGRVVGSCDFSSWSNKMQEMRDKMYHLGYLQTLKLTCTLDYISQVGIFKSHLLNKETLRSSFM